MDNTKQVKGPVIPDWLKQSEPGEVKLVKPDQVKIPAAPPAAPAPAQNNKTKN